MSTSVALDHHFETFVRGQIESGRFRNAGEVVRAGLCLLEESQQRQRLDALRAEIAAGQTSGPSQPADAVFDRLQAKYEARAGHKTL